MDRHEKKILEKIVETLNRMEHILNQLLARTASKTLVLKIIVEGKLMGNPVTIGAKGGTSTLQDGSGNPYVPAGAIVFASDNAAVVTVDPSSGAVAAAAGVTSGSANVSVLDQGNGLTDSVNVTVSIVAGKLVLVITPNP